MLLLLVFEWAVLGLLAGKLALGVACESVGRWTDVLTSYHGVLEVKQLPVQ
jgi:hypothetical protein